MPVWLTQMLQGLHPPGKILPVVWQPLCPRLSITDLGKDPPVIKGDDGLVEGVEVGGVAPEAGMEPVREGFEGLFIKGWCSK